MLPDIFCGVQAVIVGCCMFLCMLTGSRVTWTSLFFSDLQVYLYLICICCIFLYMVSWAMIF